MMTAGARGRVDGFAAARVRLLGLVALLSLLLSAPTSVTCDHHDYASSIERLSSEFPELIPPEMLAFLDMLQSGSPRRLLQLAEENAAEEPKVCLEDVLDLLDGPLAAPHVCNSNGNFTQSDAETGDCTGCSNDGLSGSRCQMCSSFESCSQATNRDDAFCYTGYDYLPSTTQKGYKCSGPDFFLNNSFDMTCWTSTEPQNSNCNMDIKFSEKVGVSLRVYKCAMRDFETEFSCQGFYIQCLDDCGPIVEGILKDLLPPIAVGFKCDNSTGQCAITGLPVLITTQCEARECNYPGAPRAIPQAANVTWAAPLVACVPIFFIALLALLLLITYLARIFPHLSFVGKRPFHDKKDADHIPVQSQSSQMVIMTFKDLETLVPGGIGSKGLSAAASPLSHGSHSAEVTQEVAMDKLEREQYDDQGMKRLLRGVTGQAKSGELVAIMGPSGCGKTTLLNLVSGVLADFGSESKVRGEIYINGQPRDNDIVKSIGYVPQADNMIPTLTVRESVMYSGILRKKDDQTTADISRTVDTTLEEIGLTHVADTKVGGSAGVRGVSGGQRRRVTIGMELVVQPTMLMMDEPLSGLDSFSALNLVTTLSTISKNGRMALFTVHQPSSRMYDMFDKLWLLSKGYGLYMGDAQGMAAFFERHGLPCPSSMHISEHMLEAVSDDVNLVKMLNSIEAAHDHEAVDHAAADSKALEVSNTSGSWLDQVAVMFWRSTMSTIRNPQIIYTSWLLSLIFGLITGLVFFQSKDTVGGIQNRFGAILITLVYFGLIGVVVVDLLISEREVVKREMRSGFYPVFPYVTSKLLLDSILLRVVPVLLYSMLMYPLMGLQSKFLQVVVFLTILATFSATVGVISIAIVVIFPTAGGAVLALLIWNLISIMTCGILVNIAEMPVWIRWLPYLSIYKYAFEALLVNECNGLYLNDTVSGFPITNLDATFIVRALGQNPANFEVDVIVSVLLYFVFFVILYFVYWAVMPTPASSAKLLSGLNKKGPTKFVAVPSEP